VEKLGQAYDATATTPRRFGDDKTNFSWPDSPANTALQWSFPPRAGKAAFNTMVVPQPPAELIYNAGQMEADNRNLKDQLHALSYTVDNLEGENTALKRTSDQVKRTSDRDHSGELSISQRRAEELKAALETAQRELGAVTATKDSLATERDGLVDQAARGVSVALALAASQGRLKVIH
jgi:FtsZ-binding cell division protein ZapB